MSEPQLILKDSVAAPQRMQVPFKNPVVDSGKTTVDTKRSESGKKAVTSIKSDSTALKNNQSLITPIVATDTLTNALDTTSNPAAHQFRFIDEDNDEVADTEWPYVSSNVFFKEHQLTLQHTTPELFNKLVPDWFTVIIFLLICGVTVVKVFYQNIFRQLVSAFYSFAVTNQVVRDENLLVQRASILLNIIFYGGSGLFFYWLSMRYNWSHPLFNEGILRFFFFAFITAVFFSVKMLMLKFIGWVFKLDRPVAVFIFSIFLTNNLLGVLLLVVTTLMAFLTTISITYYLYFLVTIVALTFVYLLYRAYLIARTIPGYSLYYLILYFCTLEIVPLALIIKLTLK